MRVTLAEFVTSAARPSQVPPPSLPEVAFAGRSNVGKSSLINTLVMRKRLVKTSSTPGKTRMLNFFVVNGRYGFVDLPGYGYARATKGERARWGSLVEGYLKKRPTLRAVVHIMDLRHEPFPTDRQMIEWLAHQKLPAILVATKADKLGRSRRMEQRKRMAEALAIQTAIYLAGRAGAHLYVVHLSSSDGLEVVRNAKRAGARFTVETTSPYLGLTSDDPIGFLAKMVPPIRDPKNQTALWEGMNDGSIDLVGTDNTSRMRASKRADEGLHCSRPGFPVLGTHLPVLLHFGRQRGMSLDVLVERACRNPAKIYGLYPRKGTIAVGSDADLVVVDLDAERVVDAKYLNGMSDFSPFEGKRLRGWPVATVKGGRVVARDGEIVGPPTGQYLPRYPAQAEVWAGAPREAIATA